MRGQRQPDLPVVIQVVHSTVVGARRLLLGRVNYHIYYAAAQTGDTVDVLALWHVSRGEPPEL